MSSLLTTVRTSQRARRAPRPGREVDRPGRISRPGRRGPTPPRHHSERDSLEIRPGRTGRSRISRLSRSDADLVGRRELQLGSRIPDRPVSNKLYSSIETNTRVETSSRVDTIVSLLPPLGARTAGLTARVELHTRPLLNLDGCALRVHQRPGAPSAGCGVCARPWSDRESSMSTCLE